MIATLRHDYLTLLARLLDQAERRYATLPITVMLRDLDAVTFPVDGLTDPACASATTAVPMATAPIKSADAPPPIEETQAAPAVAPVTRETSILAQVEVSRLPQPIMQRLHADCGEKRVIHGIDNKN